MINAPQMPDLSVLHVELSAYLRKIVRQILLRVGLRHVHEAAGPAEALSFLDRQQHPDLIILDWNLPPLTGEEVLRRIRSPSTSPAPRLPIIVTMTRPTRPEIMKAVAAGASEIVAKPFSPRVIWEHVRGVVEIPRSYTASGDIIVPTSRVVDNSVV